VSHVRDEACGLRECWGRESGEEEEALRAGAHSMTSEQMEENRHTADKQEDHGC